MFTGIVKELGKVERIVKASSFCKLTVQSSGIHKEALASDSISVNGVCLTLVSRKNNYLEFDIIDSTLRATNLKRLRRGDPVNLEPALKLGDKVGGHFVLGHIDKELRVYKISRVKDCWILELDLPSTFRKFLSENGSVAIEGISLTVKSILSRTFSVNIVPFTYNNTNLKYSRSGNWLNVEFDYLAKHRVLPD